MQKRLATLILFGFIAGCITGCNKVQDLTDEETKLIAEYAADLLLKYDLSYSDRIDEGNQELSKMEEMSEQEQMSSTQDLTTEELTEESTTEDMNQGKNVNEMMDVDNSTEEPSPVGTEGDICKIVGISDASITYKDYLITEQYPATDEEGQFIYLEATQGYQLLVVRFEVACTLDKVANVSLMNLPLDYRIVCNGSKAANPMLTILMEDLGTLDTKVSPNEPQDAVLVFQISDAIKDQLESLDLYINYNDMENVINIL